MRTKGMLLLFTFLYSVPAAADEPADLGSPYTLKLETTNQAYSLGGKVLSVQNAGSEVCSIDEKLVSHLNCKAVWDIMQEKKRLEEEVKTLRAENTLFRAIIKKRQAKK